MNRQPKREDLFFESKQWEENRQNRTQRISGKTTQNFIIYSLGPNTLSTKGRIFIQNKKHQFDQGRLIRTHSCFRCNGWSTTTTSPNPKYLMTVMHFCTKQDLVSFGITKITGVRPLDNPRCHCMGWILTITILFSSLAWTVGPSLRKSIMILNTIRPGRYHLVTTQMH